MHDGYTFVGVLDGGELTLCFGVPANIKGRVGSRLLRT
jgi:hypothetical protein